MRHTKILFKDERKAYKKFIKEQNLEVDFVRNHKIEVQMFLNNGEKYYMFSVLANGYLIRFVEFTKEDYLKLKEATEL